MKLLVGIIAGAFLLAGCGSDSKKDSSNGEGIAVTSDSLDEDGKWVKETGNNHGNVSPQITFDKVDGAASYAIYMYDKSANNWLHWKVSGLTETSYDAGAFNDAKQFTGPYPPKGSGDHNYEVVVYALKADPDDEYKSINVECDRAKVEERLDTAGGEAGNILKKGSITGTYSSDDE